MQAPNLDESLKDARAFAWNHFDLHAKQRMEMFRSYITFIAVVYAGFVASIQWKVYHFGVFLALFSIFLSVTFFLFDMRIRLLLKISERYLLDEEMRLSQLLSNQNIRLVRKSDLVARTGKHCFKLTYSNLFRLVYGSNILVSIFLLLYLIVLMSLTP